ncbi:MAG TPA: hypothetical protein VHB02_18985 [Acidimicrobiales bacterium]|nr:hypothetical protein [Acidimicrobiales bacterium]
MPEPVAERFCGRHLLDVSSLGPVKVRRLRARRRHPVRSVVARLASAVRRPFRLPGHRTAWTPLSLLTDPEPARTGRPARRGISRVPGDRGR